MNYNEAILWLENNAAKGSILGLDRIRTLLGLLGNPEKKLKFIHVGGTNGKGSVAVFLQSILTNAGYRTGLFTSPHISVVNERIQIDGKLINDEDIAGIMDKIIPCIESMVNKPTEFEIYTAIAFLYFLEKECDIVVLEVGLGGEFDSTNIIESPLAAVITRIGLDHTKELGSTIKEITTTKSKIIKKGSAVVLYKQDEDVTEIIRERCENIGADLFISEPENIDTISADLTGMDLAIKDFGEIRINMAASYQKDNAAVVLKVVELLKNAGYEIKDEAVKKGFRKASWPGRFEVVMNKPTFIVDGSHNPQGIAETLKSIDMFLDRKKNIMIMGVMADKDYESMIDIILPAGVEFFTVAPDNSRALDASVLADIITKKGGAASACRSVSEAVEKAYNLAKEKDYSICAIGSLYMVGDIKKIVEENYISYRSRDKSLEKFFGELAGKDPVPGGGGAAAIAGALAISLGSMVANLTVNSKKYAFAKAEMEDYLDKALEIKDDLLEAVDLDAESFMPLIEAYRLPANTDKEKAHKQLMVDKCTIDACQVPLQIMHSCCAAIELIAEFAEKGTKSAVSDVGCAAALAKAALEAASLNIFINTKSMRYRDMAIGFNDEANQMLKIYGTYAEQIYNSIKDELDPQEEVPI